MTALGWLAGAGIVGFLGNEAVAVFRIRIGRQMNSAALIADGYHARTDGLTSLAVVLGAVVIRLAMPALNRYDNAGARANTGPGSGELSKASVSGG